MTCRILAILIVTVLLSVFGCALGGGSSEPGDFAAARRAASREAEQDIRRGHLELRTHGLPAPSRNEYARLLGERLGVALVPVAGCVVTSQLLAEVEAYNRVMEREIERRHGRGILDRISGEADAAWEERRHQVTAPPATQPSVPATPARLRVAGDYDEAQTAFRSRAVILWCFV